MTNEEEQALFAKLVDEKLASSLEPFEFEGMNCNDWDNVGCDGWDGFSRRCNCSNRRVSWVLSDCKTYVYGEAW